PAPITATRPSVGDANPTTSLTETLHPLGAVTFTPWPSVTPEFDPLFAIPSPTLGPPILEAPTSQPGGFFDPIVPPAAPGEAESGGPPLPEQSGVIVSYAGQVVPLLTLTGGLDAPPLAQGDIFD